MQPEMYTPPPEKNLPASKDELVSIRFRGSQIAYKYEPFAPSRGIEVKRYTRTALNPVVRTALHILIGGTFWSDFNITPKNDYERFPAFKGLDIEITECINKQINALSRPSFIDICKSVLHNSMVFGFAIAEFVWNFKDGLWYIEKIKNKPSWNFDFYTDESDNLTKIVHNPTNSDIEGALLEKFLITCFPYFNNANYYGESKLQAIFPDVELLEYYENLRASLAQKLSSKPVLHWYDGERTDSDLNAVQEGLFNMDGDSVMSMGMVVDPDDPGKYYKKDIVEVLDDRASPETLADIKDIIEQTQKRITRNIGVPDDLGVTTAPVGNYAKSRNAINILFLNINDNQEFVSDFVNTQIIPAMLEYNYPSLPVEYNVPEFGFQTLEEDYFLKAVQGITMLISSGALTGQEAWLTDFFRSLGLPANDIKPENIETEQPEKSENGLLKRFKKWIM